MLADPLESATGPDHRQGTILWLIVAHVIILPVVVLFRPTWDLITFPLAAAQIGLLGIWLGLGGGAWGRRLLVSSSCASMVVVIAHGVPGTLLWAWRTGLYKQVLLPLTFSTAANLLLTATAIACARHWGPKFQLIRLSGETRLSESFQFSVRSLFVALLVTAVGLSAAQIARAELSFYDWFVHLCLDHVLGAIYFSVASLACVWAALGPSHFWLRMTTVFGLQASFFALVSFAFSWPDGRVLRAGAGLLLETLIIMASLLVIRSSGFRIVKRSCRLEPLAVADPATGAAHPLD